MVNRLHEKIVHLDNGDWQVQSEKGKNLGTYKTKEEAEKRLGQVEYFKHINEDIDSINKSLQSLGFNHSTNGIEHLFKTDDDLSNFIRFDLDDKNKILRIKGFGILEKGKGLGGKVINIILSNIPNNYTIELEKNFNPDFWNHISSKYPNLKFKDVKKVYDDLHVNKNEDLDLDADDLQKPILLSSEESFDDDGRTKERYFEISPAHAGAIFDICFGGGDFDDHWDGELVETQAIPDLPEDTYAVQVVRNLDSDNITNVWYEVLKKTDIPNRYYVITVVYCNDLMIPDEQLKHAEEIDNLLGIKNVQEELDLEVADPSVPSIHSKKDDRYGHHNYKIEDPDLKRRLAEANPHLAKFLDDHYVWYLIAWAKGIEDGTTYQGFLNIYDDETRWHKVHGSYSDGYRPEPDLVKDIVFNSIEEDLDLDSTFDELEPGHTSVEGEFSYYVLSQQQAGIFMPEYIEFCKKHFDAEDVEFLEDTYAWATNDPDGYHDVSMCKDEVNVYIIVWDDNGDSQEQAVDIENFKANGWDSIVDLNSIPDYDNIYEDLDLDPVNYDYDPSYLIKDVFWDSAEIIAKGISKEEEDKENWVKRWGLAPGKWIINRYDAFNDAYVDFMNYKFEPWEDHVDLTCQDYPVLRRFAKTNEALDLELDVVEPDLAKDVVVLTPEQFKIIKEYFDSVEIKHKGELMTEKEMFKCWYDNWIRKHEQGIMLGDKVALMSKDHERVDICKLTAKGNYKRLPQACTFVPKEIKEKVFALKEGLDLDIDKITSKLKFVDVKTSEGELLGKRCKLPEDRKTLLYNLLSDQGDVSVFDEFLDGDKYTWELTKYRSTNDYPEKSYLNIRDKDKDMYVPGFGIFGFYLTDDIYSAVTEESVEEDLDLDLVPYTDDWKVYHDTLDDYFSLPIYDAERLVMERGHEASWFIAYYLDGTWLSGAYHDLSEELNGFMTFDEAFMKFKETEIGEDERLVVCYHQGAEYDENDELDFGEEDYPILAKGSEETEAQLFEDVDLEVSEGPKYDKQYLCRVGHNCPWNLEEIIIEHENNNKWYLEAVTREGWIRDGSLDELDDYNGYGTFEEMYDAFRAYSFGWDDEAVYLMYDEDDDEEGYSIHVLKRYNNSVDEDLDLEPLGTNLLDPYLNPISDDDIINKLKEDYNIYILPNGTVGYVEENNIDWGSDLEDEILDYTAQNAIVIFCHTGDTYSGEVDHIYVEFPKNRLTAAQVEVLKRNQEWLWASRVPEDSEAYTGTKDFEYATDEFGFYSISTNDPVADSVDDFLFIHGYINNIDEDVDLDVIENRPELVYSENSKDKYSVNESNVLQIVDIIRDVFGEDSGRYTGADVMLGSVKNGSDIYLLVWHTPWPGAVLSYELRAAGLVYEIAAVRWDGNLDEMAVARDIDKAFGFNYLNEYENKYLKEDLDLDSVDTTDKVTKFRNPEGWDVYQIDAQSVSIKDKVIDAFKAYYPEGYLPTAVEHLDENTGYSWVVTCTPRSILKEHGIMRIIAKDENGHTADMFDDFVHKSIVDSVKETLDAAVGPVDEDLDLDVDDLTPEKLPRASKEHSQYRISMAALYFIRDLKKRFYGDSYGLDGGYYLDNLISRVESGDDDLAGDILLEMFNMGHLEYRLAFGNYCVCTLVQVADPTYDTNTDLKFAKAIEEELGLPAATDDLQVMTEAEYDELMGYILDDLLGKDDKKVEEDLDLDLVTTPTERLIKNEEGSLSGVYRIGLDNKQKFIDYVTEHPESLKYEDGLSVNNGVSGHQSYHNFLNWLMDFVWVYFPEDLNIDNGSVLYRFKGKLFIMNNGTNVHDSFIFTPDAEAVRILVDNSVDTVLEDLDLDPVDENQIDDKIKEVIKRFLLDMGEYCVTIGDVLFEGNPAGIRVGGTGGHYDRGHYEPIRDAAYKVHNGEVTFYYADSMNSNQEEIDEWNRIETAATVDKATDPSDYLKNYHESNTMTYEQALYNLGELWGYSKEEIENDLISQI